MLLRRIGSAGLGLALDLDAAGLVRLQLAGDIGLLGRPGRRGRGPLLYVSLGIAGLDRGRLVGFEFFDVEILDQIRCWGERGLAWMRLCEGEEW